VTLLAPEPGLYVGRTSHARPDGTSRFDYGLFSVLLDVDAPACGASMLSIDKPGLLSFYAKDHGDRSGAPLRGWAERMFAIGGVNLDGGPVRLLAMPRIFGFVFNPISIFFGYGPDNVLRGVLYEVNNTFGETHCYVAAASADGEHHHRAEKRFHVSPFFAVSGAYEFTLKAPAADFALRIVKKQSGAADHVAVWTAKRRPLTNSALIKAWLSAPLLTFWVVGAIHWQALKVWLRGARYHKKPKLPETAVTIAEQF
jgi:DUF1365 family protein